MTKPADAGTEISDSTDEPKQPPVTSLRQLKITQALLETTWRIAAPVVLGTGLGIFLDLRLGTKPWLTLLGVAAGFMIAGKLIARLLKESEDL